jgi:delta-aminolevulinic acid dehydratase/porphobilinogen synthase
MALIPIATKSFRKAAAASSTAALQDMSHGQVSQIHKALVSSNYTAWFRGIPIMAYNL